MEPMAELEGTNAAPVAKLLPNTGTTFTSILVANCSNESLNGPYHITGAILNNSKQFNIGTNNS